jgi:hypothetical protein
MPSVQENIRDFIDNSINNPDHVYFYNPQPLRHSLDLMKYKKFDEGPPEVKLAVGTLDFEKLSPQKEELSLDSHHSYNYRHKFFEIHNKEKAPASLQSSGNVIISFEGLFIPPER